MKVFFVLWIHISQWYLVLTYSYEDVFNVGRVKIHSKYIEKDRRVVLTDNEDWREANSTYQFAAVNIQGLLWQIGKLFRTHPMVIINVPSNFQSLVRELDELRDWDEKYKYTHHFRVLIFPCDQFSKDQNWTNKQIERFSWENEYRFFIFQKVDVNGPNAHPMYLYLQSLNISSDGGEIKSDFTIFIVNRRGVPIVRLNSSTTVKGIQRAMEEHNMWKDYTSRYFPELHNVNRFDYKLDSYLFYT